MVKRTSFAMAICALLLGLVSCRVDDSESDPSGDTRVSARLQWGQSVDSATFASTQLLDVLVTTGVDTVYRRTLGFSDRSAFLPSLPRGQSYVLTLRGYGAAGDSLWKGFASFTTTGDTLRLNILVNAVLSPCASGALDFFGTWARRDTAFSNEEYQKIVFSEDSTYMSYNWLVNLEGGGRDTIFYAIERGSVALSDGASAPFLRSGQIRFNVTGYQQCSVPESGNPCGRLNYLSHLTTTGDTIIIGTWTLSRDSLTITQNNQVVKFHR
jgi:hypothetical protein